MNVTALRTLGGIRGVLLLCVGRCCVPRACGFEGRESEGKEERVRWKERKEEIWEEEKKRKRIWKKNSQIRSEGRRKEGWVEGRGNRLNMALPCVCDFGGSALLCAVMIQLSLLLKSHWSVFQPLRVPCLGLTCQERT